MIKPSDIEASTILKEARQEAKRLKSVEKQLEETLGMLERTRHAKKRFVQPLVLRKHRRRRRDLVRLTIGDTHGHAIDKPCAELLLLEVKSLDPDHIILMGDHIDCGGFLAQHHVMGFVAETDVSYEEDMLCANDFLDKLQTAAPHAVIEYLEGNHELRVETWCVTQTLRHNRDANFLRRAVAPEFLLRLKERGIAYRRMQDCHDGLSVQGVIKRGKCYFMHGFSTARNAASVHQMQTAGNLVFGHTHRSQSEIVRRISTGTVGAWNPGCVSISQPLWRHGAPTDWTQGFGVQLVAPSESFLHLNIPLLPKNGSQLSSLFKL